MQCIDLKPFLSADFSKDDFDSFCNFMLIAMVASLSEEDGDKAIAEAFPKGGSKISAAEVKFEVNGVELPFLAAMKRLHDQWDYLIKKEAQSMVQEQFSNKTEPVFNLLDKLKLELEKSVGIEQEG